MKHRASHLITSQPKERGFVLPIAMGMGLIAIVIALTAVARSQNDRITALNKKETGTSLTAAEAGAAKVQEFLNRYRAVANYDLDDWNPDNPANRAFCGTDAVNEINYLTGIGTEDGWSSIESTDPEVAAKNPEFRVRNYVAGTSAELTIEGRVNKNTTKESTSEVTFEFPVFSIEDKQAASLWATEFISGNTQVQSDIYTSCEADTDRVGAVGDRIIVRNTSEIPTTPTLPTSNIKDLDGNDESGNPLNGIKDKRLPLDEDEDSPAENPDGELNSGDEVFYYKVSSINGSFSVKDRKKVRIWVTGETIDLRDRNVFNECNDSDSTPAIDPPLNPTTGEAFLPTCSAFDVRIYANTSASTGQLLLNQGSRICDIHFHLPSYDAVFSTGGTPLQDKDGNTLKCATSDPGEPEIGNTGIYWMKSWSDSTSTTIYPASEALWRNADVDLTSLRQLPPRIGPIENWKFQGTVDDE
jgi:Tfp pilus assembly protein PilX